jgi:P-type E1-E2 ATPase
MCPTQKLQIVEQFKARGDNTVTVTSLGDGVNDVPAMKGSDICIVMGVEVMSLRKLIGLLHHRVSHAR